MAVDAILFLDNLVDETNTAASIVSASATDNGYHKDNVRRLEWGTAWKATDSGAVNREIILDLGSTLALGSAGATAYAVVAYDPRGSESVNIHLQDNTNDDTNFADEHGLVSFSISDFTEPQCQFQSFTISNPAKRYYRLKLAFPDGTKKPRIFAWGMYPATGIISISASIVGDTTGPGQLGQRVFASSIEVLTGQEVTNRVARPQQEVEIAFAPGTAALWRNIRDKLYTQDGSARPIFARFDGLRNSPQADFGMVRLASARGFRPERDQYETSFRFITEPTS